MIKSKRLVTESQAHELAELYVWDAVVSILEGSCAPRTERGQKAAAKVIAEAKAQQSRLIKAYDKEQQP